MAEVLWDQVFCARDLRHVVPGSISRFAGECPGTHRRLVSQGHHLPPSRSRRVAIKASKASRGAGSSGASTMGTTGPPQSRGGLVNRS